MIYYTLRKENGRADILSRKNNYIETKKLFSNIIFKVNENRLLLVNKHRLNVIIYIMRDD